MSDKNVIFGKNSILEALSDENREINKIIISKTLHNDTKLNQIKELAQKRGIIYQFVAREKFAEYEEFNHQGVLAYVSPIKYVELEDFIEQHEGKQVSIVMLDGIEDAHNIGAIIRTCVCGGIDGIIIPSRRTSQINAIVEKISAGAINHIPIIKVNSPVGTIQKLKKHNYWVIAAEAFAKDNYYDINYCDMNFVIVMGAEHAGVSKSILKLADFQVKIPMLTDFNSLNVSNALSIIVFETVKQKLQNK